MFRRREEVVLAGAIVALILGSILIAVYYPNPMSRPTPTSRPPPIQPNEHGPPPVRWVHPDDRLPRWNECFLEEQERQGCIVQVGSPVPACEERIMRKCKAKYGWTTR
jgi:hypothetical protein